jgi:hypothetical protein
MSHSMLFLRNGYAITNKCHAAITVVGKPSSLGTPDWDSESAIG